MKTEDVMADPAIPPGVLDDAFKWGLGVVSTVAAWLFRDLHQRIEGAKAAAAADLGAHKAHIQRDLDAMNLEIDRRRDIEAKLFDEIGKAENKNAERYNALARDMHEKHLFLTNNMHTMHTDIIGRIDRVMERNGKG
jgi:hypothetical protein